MSIPVVIAENGLGFPVRPVSSGAPSMTVASNGIGAPIVISDKGAPFIVDGASPPITNAVTHMGINVTHGGITVTHGGA